MLMMPKKQYNMGSFFPLGQHINLVCQISFLYKEFKKNNPTILPDLYISCSRITISQDLIDY